MKNFMRIISIIANDFILGKKQFSRRKQTTNRKRNPIILEVPGVSIEPKDPKTQRPEDLLHL
jgi:hypothetical protein